MANRTDDLALIILAAGKGTRMKSNLLPKVMHFVAGRPMVDWTLATAQMLEPSEVVLVVGEEIEPIANRFAPHPVVVQHERKGSGHAVMQARQALADFHGYGLILYGDTPLITSESLSRIVQVGQNQDAAVVLSVFEREDGGDYGRVVLDADGAPSAIVEKSDASVEQLKVKTLNGGLMLVKLPLLWELLDQTDNDNAQGEYYLTDILGLAYEAGHRTAVVFIDAVELQGVNNRVELSKVEKVAQQRLRELAMLGGVTMVDPLSVTMSFDTILHPDVLVEPNVFFGPGVSVSSGATVRAFSHLEQTVVKAGCVVGPYARLRPGTVLREGAKIGNFVEVKNADMGEGAKANHLSYIGDASVGANTNIGAGTITCNYDGFNKARTSLGQGVFIGSNSALVAPITIDDGAIIGAGSVITDDVQANAMAIARGQQSTKAGLAETFRAKAKAKAKAKVKVKTRKETAKSS